MFNTLLQRGTHSPPPSCPPPPPPPPVTSLPSLTPPAPPLPAGTKAALVARLQAAHLAAPIASIDHDLARLTALPP